MILRVSLRQGPATRDFIIDAHPRATIADLIRAIGGAGAKELYRVTSTDEVQPLPSKAIVAESGVLDGDILYLESAPAMRGQRAEPSIGSAEPSCPGVAPGPSDSAYPATSARWLLTVRSGPAAGAVFSLGAGTQTVGRSSNADHQINDSEISRIHLRVKVKRKRVTVRDAGSSNGSRLEGRPLARAKRLKPGAHLGIGNSLLTLSARNPEHEPLPPAAPAAAGQHLFSLNGHGGPAVLEPDHAGGLLLNRVPSRRTMQPAAQVTFPEPPRAHERPGVAWLPAILPLLLAGGMYYYTKQPTFLLFALLSPLTLAATTFSQRRVQRKRARREEREFTNLLTGCTGQLRDLLSAERGRLQAAHPSGGEAELIATARLNRLWERSPGDVDFLQLRVGTGSAEGRVEWLGPVPSDPPSVKIADVPLTLDLPGAGVVGIAGTADDVEDLVRSIIIQLGALHAADDITLTLLADHALKKQWEYLRWLPHAFDRRQAQARIASTPEEVSNVVAGLLTLVAERSTTTVPDLEEFHVVVLADADRLRRRADIAELLRTGSAAGVYAIALGTEADRLPEECRAIAQVVDGEVLVEDRGSRQTRTGAVDGLAPDRATAAARHLAPIRRVSGAQRESSLTESVTMFEMLGYRPTITAVTKSWAQLTAETTSIPIGVSATGRSSIDLVHSGPHALVGGATGAGKSQLLQTWVASMALHNRPEDLTFLFVEFKGLSAFLRLQRLPHCVGAITNLTPEMTSRALASLTMERQRRQRLLAQAEAHDVGSYRRRREGDGSLPPLPRMVIVLDEFAEMKEQFPDFVTGLISVARTGRSLGLHLILATQQVGRAVSPDIAGNADLRISLRAAVADDSHAVIGSAAAIRIPTSAKGRVLIKRGDLPLETVQTAWSGAAVDSVTSSPVTTKPWQWNEDERRGTVLDGSPVPITELDDLVETLQQAAIACGFENPGRPYTEPLPALISLLDVMAEAQVHDVATLALRGGPVIGRRDDLSLVIQEPYAAPLLRGNLSIVGSAQSGRTTTLRSIAVSWAEVAPPSLLHLHVIDGARGLTVLSALPHVGTMAGPDDARPQRLLDLLSKEVDSRLQWLSDRGMGDLLEWWAQPSEEQPLPWILLLIDRFEELLAAIERTPAETALERILSRGVAAGVTVAAAGDDTLTRMRWQGRFPARLVLRSVSGLDSSQYGLVGRVGLNELSPGRAYESAQSSQVQVAVPGNNATTSAQNEAIRNLASSDRWLGWVGRPPIRLRDLPRTVSAAKLDPPSHRGAVVLGLGGDDSSAVELGDSGWPLLVAGPPKSGKSMTLRRVAEDWTAMGLPVLVIGRPGSGLLHQAPPGVEVRTFADSAGFDWTSILTDTERAVIIDDLHRDDLPDSLVEALSVGSTGCHFAGSMQAMSVVPAPLKALASNGTLVFLCPAEPRLVGYYDVRVDAALCAPEPPGRGILATGGGVRAIQIAVSKED
jgi:S-DNA-T family DNA segregation ATPase FtsK/SpoIIIE